MKIKLILFFLSISILGSAQNGKKTIHESINSMKVQEHISYFEVTGEMFKMLAEVDEADTQFKEYVRKLSTLKMVQSQNRSLYSSFMTNTNLKSFSRLMTKKEPNSSLSFYKRERDGHKNEFLLISDKMIIYISGTIDLKSIGEFEQVMEIAGSAFDM